MLRTAIILLVTCLALGGAFAIYLSVQAPPSVVVRPDKLPPVEPLKPHPDGKGPYEGGGPGYLEQFNKQTGRLSSDMRWGGFIRHKDGTTTVTAPVISFNVAGGQRLMIVGETAQIDDFHAPEMTATSGKQPVGMPDRGTMQHVQICLYPTWDNKADPTIILTTENLAFDNATFRIATAAYTDSTGNQIAADEVPVHVTGDYLFDGRGLTVQWNDRDNRMELLEVAHGEQLTIVHPNNVFGTTAAPKDASSRVLPQQQQVGMLASADPSAAAMALPATHPAHPAKPPQPPYLARFFENVTITQGLLTKITAETMDVGFVLKAANEKPATQPGHLRTSEAASAPTPVVAASAAKGTSASSIESQATGGAAASTLIQTPAAGAAQEPVVIRWTGPLRITPAPFPLDLTPGTSVVTLMGQPVIARHIDPVALQTTEARSAKMVYSTADGSISLRPSPESPKVMLTRFDNSIGDVPTARVVAENFDYIGKNQEAMFTGPGESHLPAGPVAAGTGGAAGKTLDASWRQSASVFFVPAGHGQSAVSRAVLQGDVNIAHPQLSLQSQQLQLRFAPPDIAAGRTTGAEPAASGNGALREIIASDSVNCRLTDTAGKKQTIDCQRLDVRMADDASKNIYPRQLFADGDVQAFDSEQELDAGHLEVSLLPTRAKTHGAALSGGGVAGGNEEAVALRSLDATDHVKLHGKSEQSATCDELLVDGDPAQGGRVELIAHNGLATVNDHQNLLTGPTIVMNSATQQDTIIGPGTMHVVRQTSPNSKPANPVDVIWSDRAVVDAQANAVDAFGKVVVTQVSDDKSVQTAHSPHLHIDLENKPIQANKPTTQPALVAGPRTDVFKDKQARAITLDGGVDIRSTLNDPVTGVLQRDMLLKAPTVIYTPGQAPGHEMMQVPTAGQMLVRDYRDAAAPAGGADPGNSTAQPAADDQHRMKGLTAFAWKKSLMYTAIDHKAVMLQDVHVKHQDSDQADPAELFAQRVSASFTPAMQLKRLDADGDLTVIHDDLKTHNDSKITGSRMEYDPISHWLTVFGTSADPVVFSDATAARITQALVAKWNTESWNVNLENVMTRSAMRQR